MALGADYFAIVKLILTQGVLLIVGGAAAGLAGAFAVNAVFRQTMPGMILPGWSCSWRSWPSWARRACPHAISPRGEPGAPIP
jgi:hypothetical protein